MSDNEMVHEYTSELDPQMVEVIESILALPDAIKEQLGERVPTEPGKYRDDADNEWILTEDNHWYDESGTTNRPELNFVLGMFMAKPWVKVS